MLSGAIAVPDAISARLIAKNFQFPAGDIRALSLIDEAFRIIIDLYRSQHSTMLEPALRAALKSSDDQQALARVLVELASEFPCTAVFDGLTLPEDWLESSSVSKNGTRIPHREYALEQFILIKIENENPASGSYRMLFDDGISPSGYASPGTISAKTPYIQVFARLETALKSLPGFVVGKESPMDLIGFLREPAKHAPQSLKAQLEWILKHWGDLLGDFTLALLAGIDMIAEETAPRFPPGPGPAFAYRYRSARHEYENFSVDRSWMPSLVLIAKNTLVWLHQLSKMYRREISRLDEIPEEELITFAERGINGLWLIGIWERSPASEKIKKLCGNSEAAASAYSLFDYEISPELGGWESLDALRARCGQYGIRLAADMVPNHTGIDSLWVRTRPDLFMSLPYCPYPGYAFNGPDLSSDPSVGIWLEDHYYSRSDAAVVFKRLDRRSGEVRFIYHGNDGTGMAWNDTAQIDFLNPAAREAVKERILHVASHFNIIRFDAAMVLAKQHIRRLWYPAPGAGGAIPSRSEHAMSDEAFDKAIPNEFWREVVDLCAKRAPDTLLLAEAFWLMEGYFVRTLGMHRVYNSAFMNMLKDEKNSMYRLTIKNTQEFDRDILKRFVNFMSNPDEETAVAQFGKGDKYFGVATMLATMPGLPMIAHGQIEGFTEKYGMEFRRSYWDETPDQNLIARHEREIFPLFRMRPLFSEIEHFYLFDFVRDDQMVDENVFAYTNGQGEQRALVAYNNHWERSAGRIHTSCSFVSKTSEGAKRLKNVRLSQALGAEPSPDNFLILHEIRSGFWFIYRSEDIAARGLYITLEGYQSKVFTDIQNVHDTDGRYARLYEIVDSKGIADLDDALLEAERPDLFRALHNAMSSLANIASMTDLSTREAIQRAAIFSEMFFSRLCALAAGSEEDTIPRTEAIRGAVEWLKAILSAIYHPDMKLSASDRLIFIVYAFASALAKSFSADGSGEDIGRIVSEYRLMNKLINFASEFARGIPERPLDDTLEARAELAIAWALRGTALETSPNAHDILSWVFSDPLMRAALKVNHYRRIEYFNKERFEILSQLLPQFAWIESMQAESAVREIWNRIAKQLVEFAAASSYMTNRILDISGAESRA